MKIILQRKINCPKFFILMSIFSWLSVGLPQIFDFPLGIREVHAAQSTYDFSSCTPGTDCYAYGTFSSKPQDVYNDRFASGKCNVEISSGSYSAISASDAMGGDSDTNRYQAPDEGGANESCTVFVFELNEAEGYITQIDISWEGYGDAAHTMNLYVWDYSQSCYSNGQGTCMSSNSYNNPADSGSGNADFTMTESITSNIADFIDESTNNQITYMVIDTTASKDSFHDYTKVDITYTFGSGATKKDWQESY